MTPPTLLERLLAMHGPQHWWPGDTAFEIAIGAILTQRTSWRNAARAIANLKAADRLAAKDIVAMDETELQNLLKPCGFYRVKSKRLKDFCRWLESHNGFARLRALPTPLLREALLAIRGIGQETADAILLYACGRPVFVVDAYAYRLLGRVGSIEKGMQPSYEAVRHYVESAIGPDTAALGELHALIVKHGQALCRPQPACARCQLQPQCPGAILARETA
ncbi:endonuclease III domain-containing protein [soil metagenome]